MADQPVSDVALLRKDFDLYAEKARRSGDPGDAERWHRCTKRSQEIIVAARAIESEEEPGDIAEWMALMSGNPVEVLRRLVVSYGVDTVADAFAEVVESMD